MTTQEEKRAGHPLTRGNKMNYDNLQQETYKRELDSFEVVVTVKNVYGNELVYPVNDRARMMLNLTGKKTFSKAELEILKKVGYVVKFEAQTLEGFEEGL